MAKKKSKKSGRASGRSISRREVLKLFSKKSRPLEIREIYQALRPNKSEKRAIQTILNELEEQGKIINIGRGRAYGLSDRMDMVKGKLEVQASKVGFVLPDDKRRKDIFIAPENQNEAWHGDRVLVALLPSRRGKNPEGRVVRILKRRSRVLPVRVSKKVGAGLFWTQPTEPKLTSTFLVDGSSLKQELETGQILIVSAGERVDKGLWEAELVDVLGQETDTSVQEQVVKMHHDIPSSFPRPVQQAAAELPESPAEAELDGRLDRRDLDFVTIDGAKAKDFDDAIHVSPNSSGWTLSVGIADVSHYVQPGSSLDREARERANSYYFPQSVEPMFPEKLSNGLCSLKPDVPRLAVVVEMDFDARGRRVGRQISTAVIRSRARLTYSQVSKALFEDDAQEKNRLGHVLPMLQEAEKLARVLNAVRRQRGALDFDLPEPEFLFNLQEEAVDIRAKVRHFGHQIIEEFMIAANEAVAELLQSRGAPCLYRIHPEPNQEKLEALFALLRKTELAESLPEETDPKSLQDLLGRVEGTDLEFLVNRLLLRTMMQASYDPENQGHFGLASECYCHFTSPIRRYADLVVHRALKQALELEQVSGSTFRKLGRLAQHLSDQERVGMDAEREIIKRLTMLILRERIGETFSGVVASVAEFGFWVELKEVLAEGLVRLSTLTDDYYVHWPKEHKLVGKRTAKSFTLGSPVSVRLADVSLLKLELDLELVD